MSVRKTACASLVAFASITPVASAQTHQTTCEKAWSVRQVVVKREGKRAPGRNICRYGIAAGNGTRPATYNEKARYLRNLHRLIAPAPRYLVRIASAPAQPPAGTLTPSVRAGSFASCVAQHESGGNYSINTGNGYYGAYQFDDQTWHAASGLSGHASNYSAATQDAAFAKWYPSHHTAWPVTAPACGG